MKIQSIQIIRTNQNYAPIFKSLYCLDNMLSGGQHYGIKVTDNDAHVIRDLFNYILKQPTTQTFDQYVYDTFTAFVNNKMMISLRLDTLWTVNKLFRDLIMHSMVKHTILQDESSDINSPKEYLFTIFPHVKSLIIETRNEFWISIKHLLSLAEQTLLRQVIVAASRQSNDSNDAWIPLLSKQYKNEHYEITLADNKESILMKANTDRSKGIFPMQLLNHKVREFHVVIGDTVMLTNNRKGYVKFVGHVTGWENMMVGVELEKPIMNTTDGIWNGIKYFDTPNRMGVFVELNEIENVQTTEVWKGLKIQETSFYEACLNRDKKTIKRLLNVSISISKLLILCQFGDFKNVKEILKNEPSIINEHGYGGWTALHLSAETDDVIIMYNPMTLATVQTRAFKHQPVQNLSFHQQRISFDST